MAAKKPVKKTAATMASPSSLGRLSKGTERAGKSKATTSERQRQNKNVKDGDVRIGKGGKSYNVYDSKSGTWKRGVVKSTPTTSRVSPSARGEGGKPKTAAQQAVAKSSGYARGSVGSKAHTDSIKGKGTLSENLKKKRAEDTKNQVRNAAAVAGLVLSPALLALGGGGAAGAAGMRAIGSGGAKAIGSGAKPPAVRPGGGGTRTTVTVGKPVRNTSPARPTAKPKALTSAQKAAIKAKKK